MKESEIKTLQLPELKDIINTHRVVYLRSSKKLFIVDGFKIYKANKECIDFYRREWRKTHDTNLN